MPDGARYSVPGDRHRTQVTIERSRFVCTIERVSTADEAQGFIREINGEFPDATHNCWAYVLGPPGSTDRVGMSDDGEPHGTAGRPMLTVLLHSGAGDIAAVATRYFGGVKLGTGGLVKAYGGAVQQALESMPRAERIEVVEMTAHFAYAAIDNVRQLLSAHEADLLVEKYGAEVTYRVRLPAAQVPAMEAALLDVTRGQARVSNVG